MNKRILFLAFFFSLTLGLQAQDQLSLCLKDVNGEIIEQAVVETGGSTSVTLLQDTACHIFDVPNTTGNITLMPTKDINPTNGIDICDLMLFRNHLLGIGPALSPAQLYAADINNTGSLSSFDIIDFRRLILGIPNPTPIKTSWTFWDSDLASFPGGGQVLDIPTPLTINEFEMLGLKTGDLNFSANAERFTSDDAQSRSDCEVSIVLVNQEIATDNIYTVDFVTKDFNEVSGLQFTLAFDETALEFQSFQASTIQELEMISVNELKVDEGALPNLWMGAPISFDDNTLYFQVTFKALQDGLLSDYIEMNSEITDAIAYKDICESFGVCLGIDDMLVSTNEINNQVVKSLQSIPNPFTDATTIQFNLSESSPIQLDVFDLLGRVVQPVFSGKLAAGPHQFEVSNLPESGLYFYRLQVGDQVVTKQMICVK